MEFRERWDMFCTGAALFFPLAIWLACQPARCHFDNAAFGTVCEAYPFGLHLQILGLAPVVAGFVMLFNFLALAGAMICAGIGAMGMCVAVLDQYDAMRGRNVDKSGE